MTLQAGDIILGKYRVEELIGLGARSSTEVYRALHTELLVYRAVKVLPGDATSYYEFQQCFQAGAQYGARLNHPNIIQVHDFGQDGMQVVLVMEYAPGGSLADRLQTLRQGGRMMSVSECVRIAREVAEGLAAIHALDVVHRDLKPSNILFDAQGRAKVSDLGLAQVPSGISMLSQVGQVGVIHPGTPAYMSPEQKNSSDYLSPTSDVFALGLILFEMLTGRIYRNVRPGTRASSLRSITPVWLDDLVGRMLADQPQDRPWDGAEVAAALRPEPANVVPSEPAIQMETAQLKATDPPGRVVDGATDEPPAWLVKPPGNAPTVAPLTSVAAPVEPERPQAAPTVSPPSVAATVMALDLIRIATGPFLMGSADSDALAADDEKPQHEVMLMTYRIGKHPVTCAHYLRFVTATGHEWRWTEARKPERANHPAVVVNWHDARAFCEWLTGVWRAEGRIGGEELVRLPTEAEWEKAARGIDGRVWPWGNESPDPSRSNFGKTDTEPVGAHSPSGDSPYGVADMAGNIWEWTSTLWGDTTHAQYAYPYTLTDGRENSEASGSVQRVLRGGSFYNTHAVIRCATRYRFIPGYDSRGVGFRVVVAPIPPAPAN